MPPTPILFCWGFLFPKLLAGNVSLEISLAENFVTYFLAVISLRLLGKHFLFRYFFEKNVLQYLFGRELLFWDFRYGFPCSEFLENIFGTYFLFGVFVWIMCFFQGLFERNFVWEFICRSLLVRISLDMVLVYFFSLNICFVDFFLKYFSVRISFDNCFVEIPLQGVCGRNVSSNTFSVECISSKRCLMWRDFGVKPGETAEQQQDSCLNHA